MTSIFYKPQPEAGMTSGRIRRSAGKGGSEVKWRAGGQARIRAGERAGVRAAGEWKGARLCDLHAVDGG